MKDIKQNLNEKQAEAAFHKGGPLLIAAGAGSGKTKTLTSRLLYLLEEGANPEEIIAITFTNKAAKEMAERVAGSLSGTNEWFGGISPFIGTFHSLGARILRKECRALGRSPAFSIFDDDDSAKIIRRILKSMNLETKSARAAKAGPAYFSRKISEIKNEVLRTGEADDRYGTLENAIYNEYEEELQKNNAFDFDDLIEKPVRIFEMREEILKKYRDKFKYILVDEYQDINNAQYLFIKLLAAEHQNLSVVGDDSQAIYSFRGANFKNFLNFEHDWPNAKTVLLEESYRSTSNIISAASSLIAKNKLQTPKKLWTKNEAGNVIKITEHSSPEDEAYAIATRIRSLGVHNDSIAILYRTNAQSRAIEQILIEHNIPYRIFGGMRFYDRKEIRDIVAGLRYAINPQDSVSLERLEKNFLKKQYLALREMLPEYASRTTPAELIEFILGTTDYFSYLAKHYPNAVERIENIQELIRFAGQFRNIAQFLEQVSLTESADAPDESTGNERKQPISVMTIHLAKGLEFDSVFLTGANEGLIPHERSLEQDEDIEEERRLMYVAMTRARKNLYISFYDIPTRFLSELPPELVEFTGNRDFDDEERWISLD